MTAPSDTDPGDEKPRSTTEAVVDQASREKTDSLADTANEDWQQGIDLKRWYAKAALIGLALQVALADIVFIGYGFAMHWRLPTAAISAWLGATVFHVLAITLAVARGLFPGNRR